MLRRNYPPGFLCQMYRIVLVVSVDKERERDLSIRELCHQHTETCYNAANQFGLKPEPHIFIDAQVFVTLFVFERSGGKSPDVILIMCNHGHKCIGGDIVACNLLRFEGVFEYT